MKVVILPPSFTAFLRVLSNYYCMIKTIYYGNTMIKL